MTDFHKLRLALKEKLDHRRALLTDNASIKSEVMNFVLEDYADKIVNEVLCQALDASEVVMNETLDSGDYEVGISIPSLHIRRRFFRADLDRMCAGG